MEDQPTNDNLEGAATGQGPEGRSPRRDLMAIHVVGRAANALILGLARSIVGGGAMLRNPLRADHAQIESTAGPPS